MDQNPAFKGITDPSEARQGGLEKQFLGNTEGGVVPAET
jgi:hypothetical protein